MKKDKQWLEHWLGTEKGLATASELYGRWISALTSRPAGILRAFAGDASLSTDFFVHLLHIGPEELKAASGCGQKAALTAYHRLLHFHARLIQAFFEDLVVSYSHALARDEGEVPAHQEVQHLKEDIDSMTARMSRRSQNVVNSLFRSHQHNVGLLYRTLSGNRFNCRALPGVGPVIYPEVRSWCEGVVSLVKSSMTTPFPYHLIH